MNTEMHDDLDQIFSREETIVPSSGFAVRVMEAVKEEAAAPPPIAFPWKRALPGLAACLVLVAAWVVKAAASLGHVTVSAADWTAIDKLLSMMRQSFGGSGVSAVTVWLVLAILLSLATMELSLRIAGVRE